MVQGRVQLEHNNNIVALVVQSFMLQLYNYSYTDLTYIEGNDQTDWPIYNYARETLTLSKG